MKIEVTKGNSKINIDSSCYPAWEKAGWKKAKDDENTKEKSKGTKVSV